MSAKLIKLDSTELTPGEGWKCRDASDEGITRLHVSFPNGYEASIVRGPGTYGGDEGKFEGAVMHKDRGIVYDTPITNDVEGWLTAEKAIDFIKAVAALPERK